MGARARTCVGRIWWHVTTSNLAYFVSAGEQHGTNRHGNHVACKWRTTSRRRGTRTLIKKGYTFTAEVYSGVECGRSPGATYPCLMLSHTRLKGVNILSRSFTIRLGAFYTNDGWVDSLPGSCQTVPEYMGIYFFLTENPKENGVNGALERGEKAKIGFAADLMTAVR